MSYLTENNKYYQNACEFTVAIKLNVPVYIEPQVIMQTTPICASQKLPIHLEPEVYLQPEVKAAPTTCLPQSDYAPALVEEAAYS